MTPFSHEVLDKVFRREKERRPWRLGDWVTDGHVAMLAPDYQASDRPDRPRDPERGRKALTEEFPSFRRAPAREREGWRIASEYVEHIADDCEACNGEGVCTCHCGDEHDCQECDGEGEDVKQKGKDTIGQIVVDVDDPGHPPVLLTARFAPLFDAAASVFCAIETAPSELNPIGFLDAEGNVIGWAMPMRGDPVEPGKGEAP